MKNYVGFSLDHSISMHSVAHSAKKDFNAIVGVIKQEAVKQDIDTIVSVVQCSIGRPARNDFSVTLSSVARLNELSDYPTTGNCTKLFDSVMLLIKQFESVPDYDDEKVAFMVNVVTDGEDNNSQTTARELADKIKELQKTDKWTFVFRVPAGSKASFSRLGIPSSNIYEWELTNQGMEKATAATATSFSGYFAARSAGQRSVSTFYADAANISVDDIKASMKDISAEIEMLLVSPGEDGMQIRDLIEKKSDVGFKKGNAFYQLTKREEVSDTKDILIQDKKKGHTYVGPAARSLLGLPSSGTIKIAPGDNGQYNIYIQSTSVNRKVSKGSYIIVRK
jgi:hypothetical protein